MFKKILLGFVVLVAVLAFVFRAELREAYAVATLFDEDKLVHNFQHMYELYPSRRVGAAGEIFRFGRAQTPLPERFSFDGREVALADYLERRRIMGLLVVKADRIVHESYRLGATEDSRFASHSMGKSVVSALVGTAVAKGEIASVRDPVTDYLEALRGSGYDGVSIEHCLHMASGVAFDEDYGDWRSDINRMSFQMALGQPLVEFIATLERVREPGTFREYVSINTEVLGMVVEAATGRGLADLLEERIWSRIGTEADAYWIQESTGRELAMGGLSATLRDYARFARLYLNYGQWKGQEILPFRWVRASVRADAPHLRSGPNPNAVGELGYGYQWWLPDDSTGEFMALGIYGQAIYVHPRQELIIVKTAADPRFQDDDFRATGEAIAAFRAIGAHLEALAAAGT